MKLYDQHLHSHYSVDSQADPVANCEQALAAGLAGLTFTEHYDTHPSEWDRCRWDYDAIAATIAALRRRFSPPLEIGFGIEVDYQPELIEQTLDYLDRHAFDVVLLSVHWVGGRQARWVCRGGDAVAGDRLRRRGGVPGPCAPRRPLVAGLPPLLTPVSPLRRRSRQPHARLVIYSCSGLHLLRAGNREKSRSVV